MCHPLLSVRFVGLLLTGILLCGWQQESLGQGLRYDWKQGQKFSYRFDIKVTQNDRSTNYTGMTYYTVNAVGESAAQLDYRGALRESTKVELGGRMIPFGRRSLSLPSLPSAFGRSGLGGLAGMNNTISISPRGKVLALEGDSQLPFLLGNASLIPFELLPEGDEKQWTLDSGISISEESDSRFGRFGPAGMLSGRDKSQAATAETKYKIKETEGDFVKIQVEYQMKTPDTPGNASFVMSGDGVWTFDKKDHVPHALDMKYELEIKDRNVTVTLPISVKYDRISEQELAKMEAEAKRRAAEAAAAAAAAKVKAETPLTSEEKSAALQSLASDDLNAAKATLVQLAAKSLKDPDAEIVTAIERLLNHSNPDVHKAAEKALVKWSPRFKQWKQLEKDYEGPGSVKSSERKVESGTPLAIGQVVQVRQSELSSLWRPAKVEATLDNEKVRVAFLAWGKSLNSEDVTRSRIQLAPLEFEQGYPLSHVSQAAKNAKPMDGQDATKTAAGPANADASPAKTDASPAKTVAAPAKTPSAPAKADAGPGNTATAPVGMNAVPASPQANTGAAGNRTWTDASGKFKVEAELIKVSGEDLIIRRVDDGREITLPITKLSPADQTFVKQWQSNENPFDIK